MNELVKIIDDEPMVSTLDMFTGLGVQHSAIMKLIKKYEKEFQSFKTFGFEILKSGGRPTPFCYLNEPQTTFLIVLMRNSEKIMPFKLKLTKEFYRMRKVLSNLASQKQNAEWLESRNSGKLIRKEETDEIKKFVEYATNQGSQSANKYYMAISKMQNQSLFFLEQKYNNLRDILNLNQLSILKSADRIVAKALQDGMERKLYYKEIYILAKSRIEMFAEIHGKSIIPNFSEVKRIK